MIGKKGGLMKRFKEGKSRRERLLFPPSIDEYLPDSHLARVILEIVKQLDLREIEGKYSPMGQHAYSPEILLSILFGTCQEFCVSA